MELVVGASEATMKSLLGKLGGLLAHEYTLIRGVNGDLQYINDELATMQSFLRELATSGYGNDDGHGPLMKDWMKQIRDITYDIEDTIDDSSHSLHGLRTTICCYFLVNYVYEVLTWWPRRNVASRIAILKERAQQISERRNRYGVNNPDRDGNKNTGGSSKASRFEAADNQDARLQLVTMKEPVGVEMHMRKLDKWVTYIVGFGGVGKTAIATAMYKNFGDEYDYCAMVTVSQSSDLEAILMSIKSQVKPETSNQEQHGGSKESRVAQALKNVRHRVNQGTSAVLAKCYCAGTSEGTGERSSKLDRLKKELEEHFRDKSFLVVIDDVWSATMLDKIINELPNHNANKDNRIIVTTRFHAVATTRRGGADIRKVKGLGDEESKKLFRQAFLESTTSKIEEGSEDVPFPDEVWKVCGGLPLAIVTMGGHVACNPNVSQDTWSKLRSSLFPESGKDHGKDGGKDITQEEVGRIVSYCYNDMSAEIKTCSLYLSIFPKGHKISRKRLTRRWIAEGFVCEKQGLSVEDVADAYFNHLIRRKMIRAVEHSSNGKVKKFVVHDMVLEHIVAKASEENFITVVGGNWLMPPPSSKVRRLSLQGSDSKHAKDAENMNLSHVRSLTMFGNLNNQLPSHSFKFGIVQVLDLEGCTGFKHHHTKEICKMLLLKFLSLRRTDTKELPKKIDKLVNLETLDIRETNVVELPKTICQLERLVNIIGGNKKTRMALKLPEEMSKKKKMKALRILSGIEIVGESMDFHHLTELRKLAIYKLKTIRGRASFDELSSSIEYLGGYSLHTLIIVDESSEFLKSLDALSTPPKFLTALELSGKMVKLPSWINQLNALSKLTLSVTALRKDNLENLSKLEVLFSLTFSFKAEKLDPETLTTLAENKLHSDGEIRIPDGGFKSLKLLRFSAPLLPLMSFSHNAMPELERLELNFKMLEGLFGVENLVKLKIVHLKLDGKGGGDITKQIHDEMKTAVEKNPKKPKIILDLTE
ncbi:disease resistance protein Pik-2-like [Hordeum vulgare subsp. vulgare]|uniref:Disease resistance protein RPM1 n=1 Tax=Hordeum vulgare subsp. vulgare TaxID=112509 RepID=M0X6T7_HORVV|nr:disease resistance protein Pik-2-like [Hordeum vulgare subsp. vulgare]